MDKPPEVLSCKLTIVFIVYRCCVSLFLDRSAELSSVGVVAPKYWGTTTSGRTLQAPVAIIASL